MLLVCEKKIKFQSTEMKRIACQVWLTILLLKLKKQNNVTTKVYIVVISLYRKPNKGLREINENKWKSPGSLQRWHNIVFGNHA